MSRAMVRKRSYGGPLPSVPIYDGVSAMYTLRRPDMTILWTTAAIRLTRSSDGQTAYVFFDGDEVDDTITLNSKINTVTNTVPTAVSLGTWLGSDDATVRNWYGITPDNSVDADKVSGQGTVSLQPDFAVGGVILTKDGLPTIVWNGANGITLRTTAKNPDLDSGNYLTICSVHHNDDASGLGTVYSTGTPNASNSTLALFSDRRTQKFMHALTNTLGAAHNNEYLTQENTPNQKLITGIIEPTQMSSYYNAMLQESKSWSGSYNNGQFEIGSRLTGLTSHEGGIQEIIIFPSDIGSGRTTVEADINSYYTIY